MAAHAERPSVAPAVSFENGVTQVAGLIGVFGGLLGVLYVIGGAVMWLRFDAVGIPPDQAVPLVPKADLLVVGLRVMVLPALATAGVLIALASIRRGRALEFQRLSDELESRDGDEARIAEIEARLAELPRRPRPLGALPAPLRRPRGSRCCPWSRCSSSSSRSASARSHGRSRSPGSSSIGCGSAAVRRSAAGRSSRSGGSRSPAFSPRR
jgi:hypothetical protein